MRLGVIVVVLMAVVVAASPAAADPPGWDEKVTVPGNANRPPSGQPVSGHLWWGVRAADDPQTGERCWGLYTERHPGPPPEDRTYQFAVERLAIWDVSGIAYEACSQPVPIADLALELWVSLTPEGARDLRIPPGWALPGLGTYLVFDGPGPLSASTTEAGITITISATPEFVVDWGDGSEPLRTSSHGVPYPGGVGEIRHVYTDAGEVTVTVTTEWTARFTAPGIEQGLPGRSVDAQLALPIRQRQAVRTD